MLIINSAADIGAALFGDGPLSDLTAVGLEDFGLEVIRGMAHPLYGNDWEEWIATHEEEIREEAARRGGQATNINIRGLVEDGYLDLTAAFEGADWTQLKRTAITYVMRGFCPDEAPETIEMYLYTTQLYGIRVYRWEEVGGEWSVPYLSAAEALAAAKQHAATYDDA